jgi:hypothetical protein
VLLAAAIGRFPGDHRKGPLTGHDIRSSADEYVWRVSLFGRAQGGRVPVRGSATGYLWCLGRGIWRGADHVGGMESWAGAGVRRCVACRERMPWRRRPWSGTPSRA